MQGVALSYQSPQATWYLFEPGCGGVKCNRIEIKYQKSSLSSRLWWLWWWCGGGGKGEQQQMQDKVLDKIVGNMANDKECRAFVQMLYAPSQRDIIS